MPRVSPRQHHVRPAKLPPLLIALLFVVSVATCALPSVARAGMEEEAERQLGFARDELSEGRFTRAIASAESALRLNPAAYEAFLVKALAYEQLGELELASSLLVAYQEITKGLTQDLRAAEALDRIRAARSGPARGPNRSRSEDSEVRASRVDPDRVPTDSIDLRSYEQRVQQAIAAGKCAVAMATASELTMRSSAEPRGFKLVGDAARCAGTPRPAVVAYRRYQELGGDDPKVGLMVAGLAETLATLDVVIERQEGGPVPLVRLALPWGETLSPVELPAGALRFTDLPTGASLSLAVAGRGLEPLDVGIEPLRPGESRSVDVHPVYVGLGTVRIAGHDPALCATTLLTADGEADAQPGSAEQVTAGELTALVTGEHGELAVPLEVPPDGELTFDPSPWVPTQLTVVGLPTGAGFRIFVEGYDDARVEVSGTAPGSGGRIDVETGVRLAEPLQIGSLVGGSGGLFVSHPLLGEGAGSLVLEPGSANATTFDWRKMPGVARVSEPYQRWSVQRADLQRRVRGRTAAPVVLAIGSAIASGVMFAMAADADRRVTESAASRDVTVNQAAHTQRTTFTIIGGATAGVAVIGFVIAGAAAKAGEREIAEFGEWDPLVVEPVE